MWKGGKISLLKVSNVRAPTPPQEVGKSQVRELSRPPVLPHPVIIPPEPVPQARHQYGGGGGYDNGLMGVLPSQVMISPPKKSNAKSGNQGNRWSNKDGSGGHGNKLLSPKNNNAKPPTKKTSTSKLPQDFQDTRPKQRFLKQGEPILVMRCFSHPWSTRYIANQSPGGVLDKYSSPSPHLIVHSST
ncbi:hypothetical protein LSH36_237g03078 [Paralvinella palmiformis]|uniref:Uncharacterized protein n=1 Tax=Paralvinella palmiformis TaxID=53620 RepID=A0AAD9N394_9ANNE|nr:hypothetical protein LSH36_237g03078 [Paralvinella palmiformis]